MYVRPPGWFIPYRHLMPICCWKNGKCVTPESINQIALLQVRYNDTLRLIAKGPEAEEALIAFRQLAEDNFGETEEVAPPTLRPVPPVSGKAFIINQFYVRYRQNQS